jgi:hypothetical protein
MYGAIVPSEKLVALSIDVSENEGPTPVVAHERPASPMRPASRGAPDDEPDMDPEDPEEEEPGKLPEDDDDDAGEEPEPDVDPEDDPAGLPEDDPAAPDEVESPDDDLEVAYDEPVSLPEPTPASGSVAEGLAHAALRTAEPDRNTNKKRRDRPRHIPWLGI